MPISLPSTAVNGQIADATAVMADLNALLGGVNSALMRDGTSLVAADIPFAGYKITGLGAPTITTDAATKGYVDTATVAPQLGVKAFGAKGDGTTDDTAAFTAWVAALNAGTVSASGELPTGNYSLNSATLASAPLTLTRDVRIYGGNGATITLTGTAAVLAIFHVVNVGATFEDILFVGNNQGVAYVSGGAIFFELTAAATADMLNCHVRRCRFDNFRCTYCVELLGGSATFKISGYSVVGCRFTSRAGNSIGPAAIGTNAALICAYGNEAVTPTGTVESGLIADNLMEATYVKAGVQLFHGVRKTIVRNNTVINAGLTGAADDSGAYGIFAYSNDNEATDNQIVGNTIINARSLGIYVRGTNERIVVMGNIVTGVTDLLNATLPKGGIAFLSATDFICEGNVVTGAAADGFFFVGHATIATKRALFQNNSTYSCGTGAVALGSAFGIRLVGAYQFNQGVEVRGFTAVAGVTGVGVSLYDSGGFSGLVLTGLNVNSTVALSNGVHVFRNETVYNLTGLVVGGGSTIKTVYRGIDMAGVLGNAVIYGVDLIGPFSSRALNIDQSNTAIGDGVTVRSQTVASGGFALGTASAIGAIADSLRFIGCDDGALVFVSGTDMGVNAPTWSATRNDFVKNLLPTKTAFTGGLAAYSYTMRGWRRAASTWEECRELTV